MWFTIYEWENFLRVITLRKAVLFQACSFVNYLAMYILISYVFS